MTTSKLSSDARTIAGSWLDDVRLDGVVASALRENPVGDGTVDVVALGKAAREMFDALTSELGPRIHRRLLVVDDGDEGADILRGEHPVPGLGSLRAGERVVAFLNAPTDANTTVFLVSGGASSLCVLPAPPLSLDDLIGIWKHAIAAGIDITTLNRLRASFSLLGGGGVLHHVHTPLSLSLIMVDNVVSGAPWVASALTYDYRPDRMQVTELVATIGLAGTPLGERIIAAWSVRAARLTSPLTVAHRNVVVVEPAMVLDHAVTVARRLGFRVVSLGSHVHGDVNDVANQMMAALENVEGGSAVCVLGAGEVTLSVRGSGRGGRCQQLAWIMSQRLADGQRPCAFVARATDGRDNLAGVAGAWVDETTLACAVVAGYHWMDVNERNDTYEPLGALGQLLEGGHTGWNLCDLYVLCATSS